jgi:putative tryptophan/tyrosine transport system substrate-binding protein
MQFGQVKRREFIALLGGAAAWPVAARAQQPKMRTIGVLVHVVPGWQRFWKMFPAALHDLGYIEGQNIRFELRSDDGEISRLSELATELARLKVDVIVCWFTPAAIAAKQATREIPIVCALCGDMIGTGLVENLARPGGNVTGNSSLNAELAAKAVDLIRQMVPSAHRIGALANAPDPFSKSFLNQIQNAGESAGTEIEPIMINSAGELDAAFAAMETSRVDALIVQPSLANPTDRPVGAQVPNSERVRVSRLRLRRRTDVLFRRRSRDVPHRRCARGQSPQGRQTSSASRRTAH